MRSDFALAVDRLEPDWQELRGADLLLTGGTGFVGKWLLGTLLAADERHGLGLRICIPTRNPAAFTVAYPSLARAPQVGLLQADITALSGILRGRRFSHIVHAATDASAQLNRDDPLRMIDTVVVGTREVLRLAEATPPRRLLFISSGAVYGPQPPALPGLPEEWAGGPDPLAAYAAYHEAKRLAEQMCAAAARSRAFAHVGIARLFAFVGPFLPLDTHFAIGNFIGDALARRPIAVRGDGSTVRSYLYAGDMAAWTLAILLRGRHMRAYNVGSSRAISLRDLATLIDGAAGSGRGIAVLGSPDATRPIDRYVPDNSRVIGELGVVEWTSLDEAVRHTVAFHSALQP